MQVKEQIGGLLRRIRAREPLIHHITNYVTANDCANAVLAIGASPIMADDGDEVEEIVSLANALVLNMGTLNQRTVTSMIAAGRRANDREIPVIFDPVGAGVSTLRNRTIEQILSQVKISILRGNLSEVAFVAGLETAARGVDAAKADEKNDPVEIARQAVGRLECVVAITGEVDVITDGERTIRICNGHPMLSRVTGTGCMTTSLVGAFAGVSADGLLAAAGGVASMGIAGEMAYEKMGAMGTGSFHMGILDGLSKLNGECFEKYVRLEKV